MILPTAEIVPPTIILLPRTLPPVLIEPELSTDTLLLITFPEAVTSPDVTRFPLVISPVTLTVAPVTSLLPGSPDKIVLPPSGVVKIILVVLALIKALPR